MSPAAAAINKIALHSLALPLISTSVLAIGERHRTSKVWTTKTAKTTTTSHLSRPEVVETERRGRCAQVKVAVSLSQLSTAAAEANALRARKRESETEQRGKLMIGRAFICALQLLIGAHFLTIALWSGRKLRLRHMRAQVHLWAEPLSARSYQFVVHDCSSSS